MVRPVAGSVTLSLNRAVKKVRLLAGQSSQHPGRKDSQLCFSLIHQPSSWPDENDTSFFSNSPIALYFCLARSRKPRLSSLDGDRFHLGSSASMTSIRQCFAWFRFLSAKASE